MTIALGAHDDIVEPDAAQEQGSLTGGLFQQCRRTILKTGQDLGGSIRHVAARGEAFRDAFPGERDSALLGPVQVLAQRITGGVEANPVAGFSLLIGAETEKPAETAGQDLLGENRATCLNELCDFLKIIRGEGVGIHFWINEYQGVLQGGGKVLSNKERDAHLPEPMDQAQSAFPIVQHEDSDLLGKRFRVFVVIIDRSLDGRSEGHLCRGQVSDHF